MRNATEIKTAYSISKQHLMNVKFLRRPKYDEFHSNELCDAVANISIVSLCGTRQHNSLPRGCLLLIRLQFDLVFD